MIICTYRLGSDKRRILCRRMVITLNLKHCSTQPTSGRQFACTSFMNKAFAAIRQVILSVRLSNTNVNHRATVIKRRSRSDIFHRIILIRVVRSISRAFIRALGRDDVNNFCQEGTFIRMLLMRARIELCENVSNVIYRM